MNSITRMIRARRIRKAREDVAYWGGMVEGLREAASVNPDAEERFDLADAIGQHHQHEARLAWLLIEDAK